MTGAAPWEGATYAPHSHLDTLVDGQSIASLYRSILRRDPDEAGLAHQIAHAATLGEVARSLAGSDEFATAFPALLPLSIMDRIDYLSICDERCRGQGRGVADRLHPDVLEMLADKRRLALIGSVIDPRLEEVVIAMTTCGRPSLVIALEALLAQTQSDGSPLEARIVLGVPIGVNLADEVLALAANNRRVEVRRTRDHGPITKLLSALAATENPDAIVLLADDDVSYPPLHFTTLTGYFLAMDRRWAVCASGFDWNGEVRRTCERDFVASSYGQVEGHLQQVDVVETWCGVALRRGWFTNDFIDYAEHAAIAHPDMMRTDDGFYSTFLGMRGVAKLNINDSWCNRYDTGFDGETQAAITAANGDLPAPNGYGSTSLQWIRYADHCIRMQTELFTHCKEPPPASPMLFLSLCVGRSYARRTRCGSASKAAYCRRYGHSFRQIEHSLAPQLPLIWTKIVGIREALEEGWSYVFYTDADVMITNPAFNVAALTSRMQRDIAFTYDCNGPNIGTVMVRNTSETRAFFADLLAMKDFHFADPWYEQAAFIDLLTRDEYRDLAQGFEQRAMNSYVFCWHHNDFLVHLAGIYGRAVADVMNAIHRIVYVDKQVRPATLAVLSRFFTDYTPDPDAAKHLLPRLERNERDTYVDANNASGGGRSLIAIISNSKTLKRVIMDLLLHTGRNVAVPASDEWRRDSMAPDDWLRAARRVDVRDSGSLVFDMCRVEFMQVETLLDLLMQEFNVGVVVLEETCTVLGRTAVPLKLPVERSIYISLSALMSDPEAEVHRLALFTGIADLDETLADYGCHEKLDMTAEMRRNLATFALRAGAGVDKNRPFSSC